MISLTHGRRGKQVGHSLQGRVDSARTVTDLHDVKKILIRSKIRSPGIYLAGIAIKSIFVYHVTPLIVGIYNDFRRKLLAPFSG
jgi:hypothetical protein